MILEWNRQAACKSYSSSSAPPVAIDPLIELPPLAERMPPTLALGSPRKQSEQEVCNQKWMAEDLANLTHWGFPLKGNANSNQ